MTGLLTVPAINIGNSTTSAPIGSAGGLVVTDTDNTLAEIQIAPGQTGSVLAALAENAIPSTQKNVANGVGGLNSYGRLSASPYISAAPTIVLFGDSITQMNGDGGTSDYGFFNRYQALSGHPFEVIYNAGIGGNTTTQMLERIQTDVLAYNPRWVHFLGGVNDPIFSVPTTTSIQNITTILETLLEANIKVIVGTVPPSAGATNTNQADQIFSINAFLQSFCSNNDGLILVDYYSVLADYSTIPQSLNGAGIASFFQGGSGPHPNPQGAALMGSVLNSTLLGIVKPFPRRCNSNIIANAGDQSLLNDNPLMIFGSGGSNGGNMTPKTTGLGSGEVSGVPQGWLVELGSGTTLTGQTSTVPRANYINDGRQGSMLRVDLSNGTLGDTLYITPFARNYATPNATLIAEIEVYFNFSTGSISALTLSSFFQGAPEPLQAWYNAQGPLNLSSGHFIIRTNQVTVPAQVAGTDYIFFAPQTSPGAVGFICVTGFKLQQVTPWVAH